MTSARDAHDSEGGRTGLIDKIIALIDKRCDDGWDEIAAELKAIAEHETTGEEDVMQCGNQDACS